MILDGLADDRGLGWFNYALTNYTPPLLYTPKLFFNDIPKEKPMIARYFVVDSRTPKVLNYYNYQTDATQAAEREAKNHPGVDFVVCMTLSKSKLPTLEVVTTNIA